MHYCDFEVSICGGQIVGQLTYLKGAISTQIQSRKNFFSKQRYANTDSASELKHTFITVVYMGGNWGTQEAIGDFIQLFKNLLGTHYVLVELYPLGYGRVQNKSVPPYVSYPTGRQMLNKPIGNTLGALDQVH